MFSFHIQTQLFSNMESRGQVFEWLILRFPPLILLFFSFCFLIHIDYLIFIISVIVQWFYFKCKSIKFL